MVEGLELHDTEIDKEVTILPINHDLQEIQQQDQHDNVAITIESEPLLDNLPLQSFDEDEGDAGQASTDDIAIAIESDPLLDNLPLQSFDEDENGAGQVSTTIRAAPDAVQTPTTVAPIEDDSEALPHARSYNKPSKLKLAIGLWCHKTGISRTDFDGLFEIFHMPEMATELWTIPSCLATLKRETITQLPLLQLRKKTIPLNPEQLSSDKTPKNKGEVSTKSEGDLIFFDPLHLFKSFITSDIRHKLHLGLGEFHDSPVEIWQSHSWRSSIRTTSGEFAHYLTTQLPIFPSDFLTFRCCNPECDRGCAIDTGTLDKHHLGRVHGIGRDFRSASGATGKIILEIQEVLRFKDLQALSGLNPPLTSNEAMLSWDIFHFLREDRVGKRETKVILDYNFQDDKLLPLAKRMGQSTADLADHTLIRRIYDRGNDPTKPIVRPLCKSNPLRAELELQTFGRDHLEAFDYKRTNRKTISVPLMTFIDGFGLYRNAYRTLVGVYTIFAGLSFQERARRANVIPLTLTPHGSNFADVVDALKAGLIPLDRGVEVKINGETVLLCTFTHAFIGDMPQQQKNSMMKTQRGNLGCRFCFAPADDRGNLSYDSLQNGRYHFQTLEMRKDLESQRTIKAREDYGTKWGFDTSERAAALAEIAPALDILLSRPGDPAHSEYQGLTRIMHNLLLDTLLTPQATHAYAALLRRFPFPPNWPRVQGPLHHLKSYSLSEHARWSLVIPVLLRCWLRENHLRRPLIAVFQSHGTPNDLITQIIKCFAAAATSNCVLMSEHISVSDRENLHQIIMGHRVHLQNLLKTAATSLKADPRRSRSRSRSLEPTRNTSRPDAPTMPTGPETQKNRRNTSEEAQAVQTYLNYMKLPNIHVGIHYPVQANEYGTPANCNVLIGEDKHR